MTASATPAPPPAPPRRGSRRSPAYLPYLLPGLVSFTVIILVPLALNIWYSLHKWKGGMAPMRFIGAGNYAELMGDASFWASFRNSLSMIVAMVAVPTLIGLLLAAVLFDYVGKHIGTRTASALRAMYYLPQILPVSVAGIVWNWILNSQTGAVNVILRGAGLADPTVIFMSALQRVDPELYEAAELDGAGWFTRFRAITVPQIKPETFVIVLTCTIAALKVFAPIYVLTRGGPESSTLVPSYYSYLNFFDKSKVGYGAAISTVLTVVIIAVAGIIQVLQNRSARRDEEGR